ncbi:Mg2+-importing ATPase [Variovorax sp. GrIS 2.14]|uniref:magnesium-translocating P-type ATPase n=1 Tax=Variovorax sp. GrIS 2.14 TaxID=3071709 RepID=UPI0038F5DECA
MTDAAFWRQPTTALLESLGAAETGLSSREAEARLSKYGSNDAATAKRTPAWLRFSQRFANPLVLILLVASGLSAVTGDVASFAIISGIVLLSVVLDFVQESRGQGAVDALRAQVALKADVLRDGAGVSLPVAQVVPGDIVRLAAGDLVPADGVLLSSRDFFVNQALLTGESYPVEKQATDHGDPAAQVGDARNVALAGTSAISGSAVMVVCETGRRTSLGQIAGTLIAKPPPTSFEIGLRRFSMLILRITFVLVLLVMAESMAFHRPWLESLIFALALAVGLTPELLPMIMTITLARGAIRLSHEKVIVKSLPSIHNLGAMDVLCTDKTGTLTQARIALTQHIDFDGNDSERVLRLAWLNSHFESGLKSPLDDAILAYTEIDPSPWRKIDEAPFDFERRRVSVLVENGGERTLIIKGAPEDVMRLSTRVERSGADPQPLTDELRAQLQTRFDDMSAQGLRLLGIASRAERADQSKADPADEQGLVFAGFAVFLDPPKASAAAALAALAASGIEVKVLTGDNEQVARHVCAELKFDPGEVLNGPELATLSDDALIGRMGRLRLFCRVTPQQKLRIIMVLKRMGQTVGFLGDGINDASALHAADVGISVDSAADVAKAAAGIILLEQDLGVVHLGVLEGRRTIVNTSKYILMASSANFGNIFSMVLAGLVLPFLPLLPIQVLLTNLIYDVAQTGLPLDNVDPESIERPIHWDMRLIQRFMIVMGPISTLFDVITFAVLLLFFHAGESFFRTGWFVESLVTQILMIFAVRTRRSLFASRPHRAVVGLAIGATALTLVLPFLPVVGQWFHFVQPPALYFAFLTAIGAGFLVLIEVVKRAFFARMAPNNKPSG